jgi:hypothetical protein
LLIGYIIYILPRNSEIFLLMAHYEVACGQVSLEPVEKQS